MLITLYSLCGILLGFIIGYKYAWTKHSLLVHGKKIDNKTFLRRLLFE